MIFMFFLLFMLFMLVKFSPEKKLKCPNNLNYHTTDVFNQSPGRRLRDLQISPLLYVSETLYETSQRCT